MVRRAATRPTIRQGLAAAAARPLAQLAAALPKVVPADGPLDATTHPASVAAIHDARVALRRLGALLRAFGPLLPAAALAALKREMRWLRRGLGSARDLDVFLADTVPTLRRALRDPAALATMAAAAWDQRLLVQPRVITLCRSPRTLRLLNALGDMFAEAPRPMPGRRPRTDSLAAPYRAYAFGEMRRRFKKLRKLGDRIDSLGDAELHGLRIRLRTFRYLCDAFRPMLPERRYAEFRKALVALQDRLGAFNDAVNAPKQARAVAASRARDALAGEALLVTGWGAGRSDVLRADLEEPWRRAEKRGIRMLAALEP